jgi:Family of unknown function (DUF6455)
MYFINSYFTVALWLSVFGGIVLAILQWHNSVATESRMKRMMLSCGIDENTAADADRLLHFDVEAARSRCRHCPVTHLCDRWLDGEAVASNSFCPNAWVFLKAAAAAGN